MSFRRPKLKLQAKSIPPQNISSTPTGPVRQHARTLSLEPIFGTASSLTRSSSSPSPHDGSSHIRRSSSVLNPPQTSTYQIEPSDAPRFRHNRYSSRLYVPQNSRVLPGSQGSSTQARPLQHTSNTPSSHDEDESDDPFLPLATGINSSWRDDVFITQQGNYTSTSHARKREKQWLTWSETVIPSLLESYLRLLQTTESLRTPAVNIPLLGKCVLCNRQRTQSVLVVSFMSASFFFASHAYAHAYCRN